MDEKTQYQAEIFANRLSKNYKLLKKWARKNDITCYRLYDKDIPEVPLAVELYRLLPEELFTKFQAERLLSKEAKAISENGADAAAYIEDAMKLTYLHIYLYERPYEKDETEEKVWLNIMADAAATSIGVPRKNVIIKTRKIIRAKDGDSRNGKHGRSEQYEHVKTAAGITGTIQEQGQLFFVNLTDYIDTGLFLDHRLLRKEVRERSGGKSILNLFCYTGSFSVYAAEGGARKITSVDMSKTYINWAKKNLEMNEFNPQYESKYPFYCMDAVKFLKQRNAEKKNGKNPDLYDIIVLDPPTFSNSKKTDTLLDVNRDWPSLLELCLSLLSQDGILYFSTNSRRLKFDEEKLPKDENGNSLWKAEEITRRTVSEDYRNQKIHRVWKITN